MMQALGERRLSHTCGQNVVFWQDRARATLTPSSATPPAAAAAALAAAASVSWCNDRKRSLDTAATAELPNPAVLRNYRHKPHADM